MLENLTTKKQWAVTLGAVAETCTQSAEEQELYSYLIYGLDCMTDKQFGKFKLAVVRDRDLNSLADSTYRRAKGSRRVNLVDGYGRLPLAIKRIVDDIIQNC